MGRLPGVHAFGPPFPDGPLGIAQNDLFVGHPQGLDQGGAGDGRSPGAVHHHLHILQSPFGQVAGVDQPRRGDDGGAVLIVVKHWDVHYFAQARFDDEAVRGLDVFKIDPAKAWPQEADAVDEFVHITGFDLEVDGIDIGKALEQDRLALHDRLAGERPKIAQPQSTAVPLEITATRLPFAV